MYHVQKTVQRLVITLPGVDFDVIQADLYLWPKLDRGNHSCPYAVMEYRDFHGGEEIAQTVFAHMVETPWIYGTREPQRPRMQTKCMPGKMIHSLITAGACPVPDGFAPA